MAASVFPLYGHFSWSLLSFCAQANGRVPISPKPGSTTPFGQADRRPKPCTPQHPTLSRVSARTGRRAHRRTLRGRWLRSSLNRPSPVPRCSSPRRDASARPCRAAGRSPSCRCCGRRSAEGAAPRSRSSCKPPRKHTSRISARPSRRARGSARYTTRKGTPPNPCP